MRGNGGVSLPDGDGIELMQSLLSAQRKILAEESGEDITTIPQVQTLYKEVQRYWDEGLRPPDDVTVVFATTTGATCASSRRRTCPRAAAATASTTTSTTSAAAATTSGS